MPNNNTIILFRPPEQAPVHVGFYGFHRQSHTAAQSRVMTITLFDAVIVQLATTKVCEVLASPDTSRDQFQTARSTIAHFWPEVNRTVALLRFGTIVGRDAPVGGGGASSLFHQLDGEDAFDSINPKPRQNENRFVRFRTPLNIVDQMLFFILRTWRAGREQAGLSADRIRFGPVSDRFQTSAMCVGCTVHVTEVSPPHTQSMSPCHVGCTSVSFRMHRLDRNS